MKRVPSSEKTRQAIRELFEQGIDEGNPKSELMQMAMRLILEEALEAKVRDLLGRGYYERGGKGGSRNGSRQGSLKTAEGRVRFGRAGSARHDRHQDQEDCRRERGPCFGRHRKRSPNGFLPGPGCARTPFDGNGPGPPRARLSFRRDP